MVVIPTRFTIDNGIANLGHGKDLGLSSIAQLVMEHLYCRSWCTALVLVRRYWSGDDAPGPGPFRV